LGSVLGGTEGAIYGYGEGGEEKAKERGMLGAAVGGGTSVALPAIGNTLASGFANFKTFMGRKDLTNIARELGVSEETAKVIQSVVQQGDADLADMLAAIDRAGETGMIADADIATQVLLDAAAAAEGGAASIARSAVEGRAREAGQQLESTLESTISPKPITASGEAADVQDIATAIAAETRPQRQAAYNKAYNTPVPYDKEAGRKIEALIGRIPPTLMRRAIQEANDEMRINQVGSKQIMADIDADGNITFIEMPNMVQLDYIKRALGTLGRETDNLQRPTADAGRAQKLYTDLNKAMSDAVPEYRNATRLGGDKIGRDNALLVGENALKPNVTAREVVRSLQNLDEGQRLYARVGLRDAIEKTINNVKATIASPDVDINQLRTVLRDLSSENNKAKVRAIIGTDNANALFRELEKANAALQLRAAVAVNSKTAIRQSMKESIEALTEPGAIQTAMQGEPFKAAQQLTKSLTGAGTEYTEAQKGTIMKEIARAMTSARGEEAKRQLRVIYNAVKENRATAEQMQQASDFLINSVTLPSTIFGTAAATRD
jgi:Ca2+-binding EF-hand superfamily protein